MPYVPPKYPGAIPTVEDLPNRTDDIDWLYAARYNELKKELRAVMLELGTDPAGNLSDLKARLAVSLDDNGVLKTTLTPTFAGLAVVGTGTFGDIECAELIASDYVFSDYVEANEIYSYGDIYGEGTFESSISIGAPLITGTKVHTWSYLRMRETNTPSAEATYGKLYTKIDNKLYFQSGDGIEHTVAYV